MRTHPHAEATYRVVALSGGVFGVEITIPDRSPTTVSSFATEFFDINRFPAGAVRWQVPRPASAPDPHSRQVAERDPEPPIAR